MNKLYESTRDKTLTNTASEAILQGLSEDGGLFVLRDLKANKIDVKTLIGKNYYEIAIEVLKLFLHDFSEEEIKDAFKDYLRAYQYIDDNRETTMKVIINVQEK